MWSERVFWSAGSGSHGHPCSRGQLVLQKELPCPPVPAYHLHTRTHSTHSTHMCTCLWAYICSHRHTRCTAHMHTLSHHAHRKLPLHVQKGNGPGQEQPSPVHGLLVCGCSQPGLSTASFSLVQGPLKPHLRLVGTRCTAGPASPKPGAASSDEQSEGLGVTRMSWQALGNAPLKIRTWEVLAYLRLLPGVSQPGWRSWGMF